MASGNWKFHRADALKLAKFIINRMNMKYRSGYEIGANDRFQKGCIIPCGSIRRKEKYVTDIDLYVCAKHFYRKSETWAYASNTEYEYRMNAYSVYQAFYGKAGDIADPHNWGGKIYNTDRKHQKKFTLTFSSGLIGSRIKSSSGINEWEGPVIDVNFWINDDPGAFGAMLLFATGPELDYKYMKTSAHAQGLKLDRDGLWKPVTGKDEERIAGGTEGSIYRNIKTIECPDGMVWEKPEKRGK